MGLRLEHVAEVGVEEFGTCAGSWRTCVSCATWCASETEPYYLNHLPEPAT
jgi:hypothetical protein